MPKISGFIKFITGFYIKNRKEIDRMMLKIVQTIAEDTIKKRKENSTTKV